jgi:hypothetical protein
MKKLLGFSLLSTVAFMSTMLSTTTSTAHAEAQVLCTLGPATSADGKPFDSMVDMPAAGDAQADVKKVKALLCPKGCGKLYLFANTTSPHTVTVTDGGGTSKIVYSPKFLASVRKSYGPLGTFGVFAHDLGHHLDAMGNRPAWMKAAWDSETRADAWAGCAMAKAELKPSGLQAALLVLSEYPSARHPAWLERRAAITEGYKQCGGVVLPKLAKEEPDTAATVATSADGAPAGCTSDKECRNGRVCLQSHCAAAPERRRCGKDTDCPEPQECDANSLCSLPPGQARAPQDAQSGPLLAAALQEETQRAPAAGAGEAGSCLKACDDVRNMCVEAANGEGNRCLSTIQAEAGYRACACPSYPAGNSNCAAYCTNAYERSKGCSPVAVVRDCRADGDRCRARCQ